MSGNSLSDRRRQAALLVCSAVLGVSTTAVADHPASLQRLGRWLGVGWGDGYHVCRDGGIRPGADLPPQSFPDQFGPKKSHDTCGLIYPPGAGLVASSRGTVPCDQNTCDFSPQINGLFAPDSSGHTSYPMPATQQSQPLFLDTNSPSSANVHTLPPSWVPATGSPNATPENPGTSDNGGRQIIRHDSVGSSDAAEGFTQGAASIPMPESDVREATNAPAETESREIVSPSDLIPPGQQAPEEMLLGPPNQPHLKTNRLPPVPKKAGDEPDYLNDKAYEELPPPVGSRNDDDPSTASIVYPTIPPSTIDDGMTGDRLLDENLLDENLLDDALLDDDLLIDEAQTDEFGVPAVKLNPFFETTNRTVRPRKPQVITRVAKLPDVIQAPQSNVIRQPD
ncbi:MAG: hypothetical protein KDB00_15085 [Planctomycetales bacterium]|nr:hypothetical protein [Planctomycetales bacterium]